MATFDDVVRRAKEDRAFFGNLLVRPAQALQEAGLTIDDPAQATQMELLVRAGQENVRAASRLIDVDLGAELDWGIGAGCCSSALLRPGAELRRQS